MDKFGLKYYFLFLLLLSGLSFFNQAYCLNKIYKQNSFLISNKIENGSFNVHFQGINLKGNNNKSYDNLYTKTLKLKLSTKAHIKKIESLFNAKNNFYFQLLIKKNTNCLITNYTFKKLIEKTNHCCLLI